jgi:signal transduction histidine kinase
VRDEETARRRRFRPGLAWAVIVAVLGIAASLGGAAAIARGAAESTRQAVDHRVALAQRAVADEIDRYADTVRLVASAAGAQPALDRASFLALTRPLVDLKLSGAAAVSFVVSAGDDEVAGVQREWRTRGVPDLEFRPHGTGREHFFSVFTRRLDGSPETAPGVDAAQVAEPAAALAEARRSGSATLSRPYQFLRDQNLPANQRQFSFALVAPVLGAADAAGNRPFLGWIAAGLRGQSFTDALLRDAAQGSVNARLYATGADGREVRVAARNERATADPDRSRTVTIPAVRQRWTLRVEFPLATDRLAGGVAAGGCLLALALAGLVLVLGTARDRARAQVVRATMRLEADIASRQAVEAELRVTRDELDAQRTYLGGVLDSIDVAVIACDTEGRITLENASARRLRADGATTVGVDGAPLPAGELPLARTLREGSVDAEVLHQVPGHRPLAMLAHGRTLYSSAGTRIGAVVTGHDITALREHERELAGFAGIAAHDLKSPLAVISAYTEMLADTADGESGELLARIDNGVRRMRSLIDDLLAYSTSRDAPLDAVDVDLRQVVTDVVAARTDHLRLTAGGPFPDVYVGPLPTVHGDRAMIRQLVDNLVGNALKYVRPGQAARVDITAAAHHSWVRVEVADRGIGIAAAARDTVFAPFHRLATEHAYGGTGLGLAICQRIVDRHGGRIEVTENAGGGSRFAFTLPATPAAPATSSDLDYLRLLWQR